MLEEMRISGLGVIDDAVLELAPGLTVVTGETGAGKTMVVQGLALLAGGRADSGLVRPGSSRAFVEGRLIVPPEGLAASRAREAGAELDDGALIVGRTLTAEGRSRAHVGGRAVPAGLLGELADALIALHGQSDQQRLLRPAEQRAALDRFAGMPVARHLTAYAAGYARLIELDRRLAELAAQKRERTEQAELLRIGLAEVERVAPQPSEDVTLAIELDRLQHAEALSAAAQSAHGVLTADPADGSETGPVASDLVSAARRALAGQSGHDPALAALAARLEEISVLLSETVGDLASYAAGVEADPTRLAAVQGRKAALTAITRAHAVDVDGVLAWAASAGQRLGELDEDADRIGSLTAERAELEVRLGELAGALSAVREEAAGLLGEAVAGELASLAMPRARVEAVITQRPDPAGLPVGETRLGYGPSGVDDVELRLVPHPGAPGRQLQRGASGGELSRVMLAVEVVLAAADTTPILVFDEVDAGVGGRAAVEVGRRLARLARSHQVICVTHLPQVAAFADRHLVVTKSDDGWVTCSGVQPLDAEGRVRELSRMLAGLDESVLAHGHAEELLSAAAVTKAS